MASNQLPPGVGPHEGRELELLLVGVKPLAKFRLDGLSEEYEGQFREAVERGDILEFDFLEEQPHLHRRYYCLPGEEWRVRLMEVVDRAKAERHAVRFTEEDWHRMDGTLLGYSREDVDQFIEHVGRRKE